jgi:hypothetical protein
MASVSAQKIFNLPPGGCLRSASGFFCRMPSGAIAFIPSVFRLPWHPDTARIVTAPDIVKLLRAETIELSISVVLLLAGVHYFHSDIFAFYLDYLSLPLAVVAHLATTAAGIVGVFALNNASVSFVRVNMMKGLPKAPDRFAADALRNWSRGQRVWLLSFLSGDRAAALNRAAVVLYIMMFLCSGPLLAIVMILLVTSGKARSLDGSVGVMLAFYIMIAVWALVESSLVLRQRMLAGRARREAKQTAVQGS